MSGDSNTLKRSVLSGKKWDKTVPYLFILPFLISFLIFFAFPAIYALVLSFFSYRGYGPASFVGLKNYFSLITYGTFWIEVKNTLFYFALHIVPVMVLAFLFALAMYSKFLSRIQSVFKPILFLPQVVPIMASALIFRIMFATDYGAINQIFHLKINWLGDPNVMKWPVVILIIWRSIGWFMVIFLAGLTTISDEINDATQIDGANSIQRIFFITIPLMQPIILFAFIMDAIGSFKIFTEPNILISGNISATPDSAPIMNVITSNINGGSFGMASAGGWLLFVLIIIVSLIEFVFLRKREDA